MDPMETDEKEEIVDLTVDEELVQLSHDQLKELGNTYYKEKKYTDAINYYTQAINLCPTCAAYYGNRSATYMMLNKYAEALEDARKAIRLDDQFVKGYLREGKCYIALGDPVAAVRSYSKVLELEPNNENALQEMKVAEQVKQYHDMAEEDLKKGDYRRALFCMDRCLDAAKTCVKFKVKKAEFLCLLGRLQEAQETTNDILQRDGINADALFVRGMCLYYQDNIDKAFQHFQQVLRLAPDHQKARETYKKAKALITKKEEGNEAFRVGKYEEALSLYTEALEIDPSNKFTNSKLFCNRATVCSKINKLQQAIEDCTKAVELDDTYLKAYMRRAKCYMDSELYEEAVRDYEKICQIDTSRENKKLLQEAKLELKKSKRKDYYKILGITKNASDDEIRKAYRKRALVHHPDRHSHDTQDKQKEEEVKFKEVSEAYSVLSDKKKRMRYDNGHDLEDLEGGGFDHIDPNQIFQAFFGGGGQGFSFGGPSGFPGGGSSFSFQFG
ncbi:hypothetical protein CHS0354_037055 [Potamilus streckersoni]|uniref:J domain-containing protein n=1 Tax=Potamilus streckersoni TaxID=2493646 RepID=A0AAE0SKD7_9BIVA|nr:hypothetical protein CHS0354_037055 [Potamilus streckersoni]